MAYAIDTVTARIAMNQKCSESNGLPKNEDTKLKRRKKDPRASA